MLMIRGGRDLAAAGCTHKLRNVSRLTHNSTRHVTAQLSPMLASTSAAATGCARATTAAGPPLARPCPCAEQVRNYLTGSFVSLCTHVILLRCTSILDHCEGMHAGATQSLAAVPRESQVRRQAPLSRCETCCFQVRGAPLTGLASRSPLRPGRAGPAVCRLGRSSVQSARPRGSCRPGRGCWRCRWQSSWTRSSRTDCLQGRWKGQSG